ncbi:heparinase II/III family protein [bacterium]|nr:heparinase II/III family protein [bacterium]
MKKILILIVVFITAVYSYPCPLFAEDEWISAIRSDHPRLFFNTEIWPAVKSRALNEEKAWFAELKDMVDAYPENPIPGSRGDDNADRLRPDGTVETIMLPRPEEYGIQAGRTAFVYLVTGEKKYLETAKRMLKVSVDAYHGCIDKGMAVDWYSTSRVHWLAAYDWLYNDLSQSERRELMGAFIEHVYSLRPRPDRPPIHRLNDSDHTTGFYGDRNLVWFTGVAAYGDGIDDEKALEFLKRGRQYNLDLFEYRKKCAGDDGGLASATTTYAIAHYPWSQLNFLYTWRSATGEDIAADWPYLAYFPVWIMWNWLPGPEPREFGSGDVYHYDNRLWVENLYMHMSQFMDFYGETEPECAALAAYIREKIPAEYRQYNWTWFFYPFLLTNIDKAPLPKGPNDTSLHARHFETLGQVFMRSGAGPDDTYSLFTIGSEVPSHKQFDEGNFIIYKKGWLALDTGTRGMSTSYQLRHYYSQTVAHNCTLIHMPGEPFPDYWGLAYDGPEGKINYGGMYKPTGGVCAAFETNDVYTYVAGDVTECYLPEKCDLSLRQYVFIYPDFFVICDRITSKEASYKKEWLFHTQNEPVVTGDSFRADHEDGRIFCRTLLPKDAALTKVGGPGKEFWAAGKNWELAPETAERARTRYNGALFGNWRMEVSPVKEQRNDVFLHFLQAGDKGTVEMTPSSLIEGDGAVGVTFNTGGRTVRVTFGTKGKPSGHVKIVSGGKTIIDRDLTINVMPQSGLSGGK